MTPQEFEQSLRPLDVRTLKRDQSILSQRKDPDAYLGLAQLSELYEAFEFFTDWTSGRYSPARAPQRPDLSQHFLDSDATNLALVLNDILFQDGVEEKILERLRVVYDRATALLTRVQGGTVQLFLREKGLRTPTPASRLSDGTLRYLSLLAILCHPSPPPLVCIEEPELGLHPDILPTIAELLLEASERTQLIVTTHSDLLVSQFTERPEVVVVCDRGPEGTFFRRLEAGQVGEADLSLGEQWLKGQIGGTRW